MEPKTITSDGDWNLKTITSDAKEPSPATHTHTYKGLFARGLRWVDWQAIRLPLAHKAYQLS